MHRLKLLQAAEIRAVNPDTAEFQSSACKKALPAFCTNSLLAANLAAFPSSAFTIAYEWITACTAASWEIAGPFASQEMRDLKEKEITAESSIKMSKAMAITADQHRGRLVENTILFDRVTRLCEGSAHSVCEGVLKSMVIIAWTAVEVLLEDLCVAARAEPETLFSVAALTYKKYYFRRLESARDSYKFLFDSDPGIKDALGSRSLDALSQIRHVLVHKAGVVDSQAWGAIKDLPQIKRWKNRIREGSRIRFTGSDVYSLVDSANIACYRILTEVDRGLVKRHT